MKQKTKKELQTEIKALKSELSVKSHEDKYLHIPKLSLVPFLGTIVFGILSYL